MENYFNFRRFVYDKQVKTDIDVTYSCPEDATWLEVMTKFGEFLDHCGYVGVSEKVNIMIEDFQNAR